jgi:hypothetical protein
VLQWERGSHLPLAPDHADKRLFLRGKADCQNSTSTRAATVLACSTASGNPATGERHPEATTTGDLRLAKETQLGTRHQGQCLANPLIADILAVAFPQHHGRGARTVLGDGADGQPQDGAHVQGELGEILGDQGHHAGVVGARGDFAEPHLVTPDEELDPEQTVAAKGFDHLGRHLLGAGQGQLAHGLGLPGFAVVAILLTMADRLAEVDAIDGAHREQGDLVLERNEAFDNHLATTGTAPPGHRSSSSSLARSRSRLWPLPEELITGFTTQGRPMASTAATNSSLLWAKR